MSYLNVIKLVFFLLIGYKVMNKINKKHNRGVTKDMQLVFAWIICVLIPSIGHTSTVLLGYTESFNPVPPDGPTPYAEAIFDDGGATGTVTLTLSVATTVGSSDITGMYFSLDPALDPGLLSFTRIGGDGPTAADTQIRTGIDAFRAGGDGFYDIFFDFPPAPGGDDALFNAGESLVYEISMPGLTAQSFAFTGIAGPGAGNPGPFLSVARFQRRSSFVGAVSAIPIPAAVWLFASGLLGLAGIAIRKQAVNR